MTAILVRNHRPMRLHSVVTSRTPVSPEAGGIVILWGTEAAKGEVAAQDTDRASMATPPWRGGSVTTTVCILEDHPMMREFLHDKVRTHRPDIKIVYAGASVTAAESSVQAQPADCVILDLDLGDDSDLRDNLRRMIATGSPVLIVSASASPRLVQTAIAGGAQGYVSKQCEPDEFTRAFDAVLEGRTHVSPDLAAKLAVPTLSNVRFSPQEQRALTLYASGMKLESVARSMGVQVGTAKEYIRRVREKYAAVGDPLPSKVDLYRKAQEEGLL